MGASHLEVLVEEPSMEAFLRALLPRFLPPGSGFDIHPFAGKTDLQAKLVNRLRGYSYWLPEDWRVVVVVDRDDDDCQALKTELEASAQRAGLRTRSSAGPHQWQVVNRIAIEELEAWYFGDWNAVCAAYDRAPPAVPSKAAFRDSDAIAGGTREAFERVLQRRGYFKGGLRKIDAARRIGAHADPLRSTSASFSVFWNAIVEAVGLGPDVDESRNALVPRA